MQLGAGGTRRFGPQNGTLLVRTRRRGAAAAAGHDLLIEVGRWSATLDLSGPDGAPALALEADGGSLRVLEGTGGVTALNDDDKANIAQTIDEKVLRRQPIIFSSTAVRRGDGDRLAVTGELGLAGTTRSVSFEITVGADGRITGIARIKQTDWGIKPYSALLGALKVSDEVEVLFDAR